MGCMGFWSTVFVGYGWMEVPGGLTSFHAHLCYCVTDLLVTSPPTHVHGRAIHVHGEARDCNLKIGDKLKRKCDLTNIASAYIQGQYKNCRKARNGSLINKNTKQHLITINSLVLFWYFRNKTVVERMFSKAIF